LVLKVFQALDGMWKIDRIIKPGGVMTGQAEFRPVSKTQYHYTERGRLTTEAGDVIEDVTRAYIYKFEDNTIQIYYADGPDNGALFQTLNFIDESCATAEHLCGQDLYKSEYQFNFPDSFTIKHVVKGPKKDYVSETVFTRLK
jgi:hypothetical protein